MVCDGVLLWEDGSLRGLGAFIVWQALLLVWRNHGEAVLEPQVLKLIGSLMSFRSFLSPGGAEDEQTSLIKWVARQNQAARVQPISSFMWSSMLKQMADKWEESSVLELIEAYNSHPNVASASASSGGAGGLRCEGRKGQAINNWLFKTGKPAYDHVASSGHDFPFGHGPFSETMAGNPQLFLGSKSNLAPDTASHLIPQSSEAHIQLDWSLPLSERAQGWIFARKRANFDRHTVGIALDKRKKYRMSDADDSHLRNMVALWDQLEPFCCSRLGVEFVTSVSNNIQVGSLSDDDIEARHTLERTYGLTPLARHMLLQGL